MLLEDVQNKLNQVTADFNQLKEDKHQGFLEWKQGQFREINARSEANKTAAAEAAAAMSDATRAKGEALESCKLAGVIRSKLEVERKNLYMEKEAHAAERRAYLAQCAVEPENVKVAYPSSSLPGDQPTLRQGYTPSTQTLGTPPILRYTTSYPPFGPQGAARSGLPKAVSFAPSPTEPGSPQSGSAEEPEDLTPPTAITDTAEPHQDVTMDEAEAPLVDPPADPDLASPCFAATRTGFADAERASAAPAP